MAYSIAMIKTERLDSWTNQVDLVMINKIDQGFIQDITPELVVS